MEREKKAVEPFLGLSVQTLTQAVLEPCLAEATGTAGTPQYNSSPLLGHQTPFITAPHSKIAGQ